MLWKVEIGIVVQNDLHSLWAPFCRMTVPLEKVETTLRGSLQRLTDMLVKTHERGWELEKLIYVKVGPLSLPPR